MEVPEQEPTDHPLDLTKAIEAGDRLGTSIGRDVDKKTVLLAAHRSRLHILQVKAAKYGLECPASIELEIEEIQGNIKALVDAIEEITGTYKNLMDALARGQEIATQEKDHMQAAAKKRKLRLARAEKKRLRLGDQCPPELIKQIENDKWFIEVVEKHY